MAHKTFVLEMRVRRFRVSKKKRTKDTHFVTHRTVQHIARIPLVFRQILFTDNCQNSSPLLCRATAHVDFLRDCSPRGVCCQYKISNGTRSLPGNLAINTVKFHSTINMRRMKMTMWHQMILHMGCVSVRRWFEIRYFTSDIK